MMGLNICTRWRAISARRSRRISSSLLPLNIGPQITSTQPRLPRIAFISSSPFNPSNLFGRDVAVLCLYGKRFARPAFIGFLCRLVRQLLHESVKIIEAYKDFSGAAQQPAADLLYWHDADQVHGNPQAMREGQFALRSRAASRVLVPITDNRIAAVLDQV